MTQSSHTRNILFLEHSPGLGGSLGSLAGLVRQLDPDRYRAYAVVSHPVHEEYLRAHAPVVRTVVDRAAGAARTVGLARPVARVLDALGPPGHAVASAGIVAFNSVGPVPRFARRVARHFAEVPFDVVWTNNGLDNNFGAGPLLARRWQAPLVCKVQGFERLCRLSRWRARAVDLFLPDSWPVGERLVELGVPRAKITPTYCPVDTCLYDAARVRGTAEFRGGAAPAEAPTFGIIGMLLPWKGQHVFLEAAAKVLRRVPGSVAVVVGNTPDGTTEYDQRLRTLAQQLGIAGRVVFAGYRRDVPEVMAGLDVVVHASVAPEPFGTVVAEAMAMERAVVAARAGGPAEYVEHGVNGLLAAPGDAEELAGAIATLLLDPALRARLGRAARKTVVERFAAPVLARKTQELLERLFEGKGGVGEVGVRCQVSGVKLGDR